MEAYEKAFGEAPTTQWLNEDCAGDTAAFLDMVAKATERGKPLPDWESAHGVPDGAKT